MAAYGRCLPKEVLDLPPFGCLNVHGFLLPRWRGAAPIERAILAGDEEMGVCIMAMEEGLDTGDYCVCRSLPAGSRTAAELTEELAALGASSLLTALAQAEGGNLRWVAQDEALVTYAEKIAKGELNLDPAESAVANDRRVRASGAAHPARAVVAGRPLTVLAGPRGRRCSCRPPGLRRGGPYREPTASRLRRGGLGSDRSQTGRRARHGRALVCRPASPRCGARKRTWPPCNNDHRSHNQRRSYDRASQGDRNAQGGARQNRGPRPGGESGDFRKGGKPGGFRKDGKPGSFRKDDRGPRDGKPGGYRKDGKPGGFRKDDRGPRDEQRSDADRKDFRARDGKPTGGSAPRKDFGPRTDRGPRRDSREAGHPREVFIDGKLMAAPDQDVPQDRGPRFDGPRDGGRGGAPRRDQVRRQKAHKATTARELALAAIHQLRERDAFAQDIIAKTIDISPLSREDRAFATRLVLGVVSTRGTLEDIITGCMDSPDDAAPAVRDALCLSAYENRLFAEEPPCRRRSGRRAGEVGGAARGRSRQCGAAPRGARQRGLPLRRPAH